MFTETAFRYHYTTGFVTVYWCQNWGAQSACPLAPPPAPPPMRALTSFIDELR